VGADGSGVFSCVTFGFLAMLVEGVCGSVLLLLLRLTAMSWMDGLHVDDEENKQNCVDGEKEIVSRGYPLPVLIKTSQRKAIISWGGGVFDP